MNSTQTEKEKEEEEKKKNQSAKTKCVPIYQSAEFWTPSMKLVPYDRLPCPILEGNLAGREVAKSSGCSSQEAGRTDRVIIFNFSPK